jgi:hypothetical protein
MRPLVTLLSALALTTSFSFAEDKAEQKPATDAAKPAESAPAKAAAKTDGEKKAAPSPEERFKKMDKNGDGNLDASELRGKKDDDATAEKRFKAMDKNGDGKVTLEEFSAPPKRGKKDK